jgi:hypothetical protein
MRIVYQPSDMNSSERYECEDGATVYVNRLMQYRLLSCTQHGVSECEHIKAVKAPKNS